METLWLIGITTFSNICCFFVGAKIYKQEEINIPNPIKRITEFNDSRKNRKELKKEEEKYKIINENIDNYNGTSMGQKDIPR